MRPWATAPQRTGRGRVALPQTGAPTHARLRAVHVNPTRRRYVRAPMRTRICCLAGVRRPISPGNEEAKGGHAEMRKAASLLTILATILFFAFALSAPAAADPNGPGNNGTVKVVNNGDDPIGADDRDNDPHVCQFHIYGFHFDNSSSGTWQIESWPPTGNRTVR